jgi:hypothetical protein
MAHRAIASTRSKGALLFLRDGIDTHQGVRENSRLFRQLSRDDHPKVAAARFPDIAPKSGALCTAIRCKLRGSLVSLNATVSVGESPSGKAPDFDSGIRRFDPYLPSHLFDGRARLQGLA